LVDPQKPSNVPLMRLFSLLASLLLFAGCGNPDASNSAPGSTQIVRLSDSEIKGLDPQKISDLSSLRIAADQFEGMTRHNAAGQVEPGLAESWNISDDGLRWTFTLKSNLNFSDGSRMDATLFPRIFERLQASETAAPAKNLFENITAVNAETIANGQQIVIDT